MELYQIATLTEVIFSFFTFIILIYIWRFIKNKIVWLPDDKSKGSEKGILLIILVTIGNIILGIGLLIWLYESWEDSPWNIIDLALEFGNLLIYIILQSAISHVRYLRAHSNCTA